MIGCFFDRLLPLNKMLPPENTPLYNHTLPLIEKWLRDKGCQQDRRELNHWQIEKVNWQADIWLDIEQLTVRYIKANDGKDIQRSFKYSLSRRDIEEAVFSGP
jgi:predicted Fe-S protein YdhL (DUF1289 family)